MKRLLLAGATIFMSCNLAAMAADMPAKAPPPSPAPAAAPGDSWTGFYIGGHLGGTSNFADNVVDLDGLNGGAHYDLDSSTSVYGGQAGYNFQWGWLVIGVEGDYSSIRVNTKVFDPNFVGGTFSTLNGSYMYDVTGRAGIAYNGLFVYFKGGGAWTNIAASVDNTLGGFAGGRAYTGHFNGSIYGGGVEWYVFPNISASSILAPKTPYYIRRLMEISGTVIS